MAPMPVAWEIEFLGEPLAELSDDHLPTLGEVFRYYYHVRQNVGSQKPMRTSARLAVNRCLEIWRKFVIHTIFSYTVLTTFLKLLRLFKSLNFRSLGDLQRKKKLILWRRKVDMVFNIAAKSGINQCSRKNKKLLRAIEREEKELQELEGSIRVKNGNIEGIGAWAVKNEKKAKTNGRGSKRKVEDNLQGIPKKERKAARSKKGALSEDSDDKLKIKVDPTLSDLSNSINALSPNLSLVKEPPEEEEIVPPNLPVIIIKEEVDFTWDDEDNFQTSLLGDEYGVANCSFEKNSVLSAKFDLHSFVTNDNQSIYS